MNDEHYQEQCERDARLLIEIPYHDRITDLLIGFF
jgi:hypothetical protein